MASTYAHTGFSVTLLALLAGTAAAQPANNFCNTPASIAGTGSFFFTCIGASTDGPSLLACGAGTAFNDVWFCWTPQTTGRYVLSTCGTTSLDTVLALYPVCGCLPFSQSPVACNDDTCGTQSRIEVDAIAGRGYFVRIGTYAESQQGAGNLIISSASATTGGGDTCSTALPIGEGVAAFSLATATTEAPGELDVACGDGRIFNDVWFIFEAPQAGPYRVETCNFSSVDTVLAAYAGPACPSGTAQPIACSDDACGTQSSIIIPASEGGTYLIRLGSYSAGGRGAGSIKVESALFQPAVDGGTGRSYALLAPMSWSEANASAAAMGGYLATISDAAEASFIRSAVLSFDGSSRLGWLGLTDQAAAGVFVYTTGEPVVYSAWASGQPLNSATENFVSMSGFDGSWRARVDRPAVDNIYGIVEFGSVAVPTCIADVVGGDGNPPADGTADGNDFIAFLNAFASSADLADLVGGDGNPPGDGNVDGNDFSAFLNGFGAGC